MSDKSGRPDQSKGQFLTSFGTPQKEVFLPEDLEWFDYYLDSGFPGEYPFTRGPFPEMYRSRPWSMRRRISPATASRANAAYRSLIEKGATVLPMALDLPTLWCLDSDHPSSGEEAGAGGLALDSLADMEELFRDIPVEAVSLEIEADQAACFIMAMYIALAGKRGIDPTSLRGTVQNDILSEYCTGGLRLYPLADSIRTAADLMEFCCGRIPSFNPVRINAHQIRETGSDSVQEVAFSICIAIEYLKMAAAAGFDADCFAPRMSFVFSAQSDILEEVAKFRAARKLWSRIMKERFGATMSSSCRPRFHAKTSAKHTGPDDFVDNSMRHVLRTLSAVLGGVQSIEVRLPEAIDTSAAEEYLEKALRIQEIIAAESGLAGTADPLGGSYAVEWLTREIELKAAALIHRVDEVGGMTEAIKKEFVAAETARIACRYRTIQDTRIEGSGEKETGGKGASSGGREDAVKEQYARLRKTRETRDNEKAAFTLEEVKKAARTGQNLMPALIDASSAYATIGEMAGALKDIFGSHE